MRAEPEILTPAVLVPADFEWESLGLEAEADVRNVVGPERSRTLGAGIGRFHDAEFEWSLGYDEVLYVIAGEVTVEHAGGTEYGGPGDVFFVPRGNTVTYRFAGECEVFFATYPVDWAERADG